MANIVPPGLLTLKNVKRKDQYRLRRTSWQRLGDALPEMPESEDGGGSWPRFATRPRRVSHSARAGKEAYYVQVAFQYVPPGVAHRRWTLRDDNHGHHHGVVRLAECPLYLELHWRKSAQDLSLPVGVFRLNLGELLRGGYIRHEPVGTPSPRVRVRVVREGDGSFYVQARSDVPRFFLAQIK